MDNLVKYRLSGWFEVNKYETAEISITDSDGGFSSYLIFASHNAFPDRSFAGIVFGSSDSWGYGLRYNSLIINSGIQITQGSETKKELIIKNNTSSQYMVNFLNLRNDNSKIKFTIIS